MASLTLAQALVGATMAAERDQEPLWPKVAVQFSVNVDAVEAPYVRGTQAVAAGKGGTVDIRTGVAVDVGNGRDGIVAEERTLVGGTHRFVTVLDSARLWIEGDVTIYCMGRFAPRQVTGVFGQGKPKPRLIVYAGSSEQPHGCGLGNAVKPDISLRVGAVGTLSFTYDLDDSDGGDFTFYTSMPGGIHVGVSSNGGRNPYYEKNVLTGTVTGAGQGGDVTLLAPCSWVDGYVSICGSHVFHPGTDAVWRTEGWKRGGDAGRMVIVAQLLRKGFAVEGTGGIGASLGSPGSTTTNGYHGGNGGGGALVLFSPGVAAQSSVEQSVQFFLDGGRGGNGQHGGSFYCCYDQSLPGGTGGNGGNGGAAGSVLGPRAGLRIQAVGGAGGRGGNGGAGFLGGAGGVGGNGGNGGDTAGELGVGGAAGAPGEGGSGSPPGPRGKPGAEGQERSEPTRSFLEVPDIRCSPVGSLRVVPIQAVLNRQPEFPAADVYPLVARKDLVVRAFAATVAAGPDSGAEFEGRLVIDDLYEYPSSGIVFQQGGNFDVSARRRAWNSLNFYVTGDDANAVLTKKDHRFQVEVWPKGSATVAMRSEFRGVCQESQPLQIVLWPITMQDSSAHPVGPDPALLENAAELMEHIYPVDEENVEVVVLPPRNLPHSPPFDDEWWYKGADIEVLLQEFADRQIENSRERLAEYQACPAKTFLVLVFAGSIGDQRPFKGTELGVSRRLTALQTRAYGIPYYCRVTDRFPNVLADGIPPRCWRHEKATLHAAVAHEIGHCLDLSDDYYTGTILNPSFDPEPPHLPSPDATGTAAGYYVTETEMAFDATGVRARLASECDGDLADPMAALAVFISEDPLLGIDPDPVAGGAVYGYMGGTGIVGAMRQDPEREGFGNTRVWTREADYERLYRKLTSPVTATGLVEPREVIRISGAISDSGQALFDRMFTGKTAIPFRPPEGTQYRVELRGADGRVVGGVGIDIALENSGSGQRWGYFSFVAELPPVVQSIVLLKEGTVLATNVRSVEPPTVRIEEAVVQDGRVTVRASGTCADGAMLQYRVLYSPDGGAPYSLAMHLETNTYGGSLDGLPSPGPNAAVVVRADDGFDFAEDMVVVNPELSARVLGNELQLEWLSAARGFVLEESPSLSSGGQWHASGVSPTTDGTTSRVTVNGGLGQRYYRLRKGERVMKPHAP